MQKLSSRPPRVRIACEPCHERKHRCLIEDGNGACNACLATSRQCYFVLRGKAGRPRRQTEGHDHQQASSSRCDSLTRSPMPGQMSNARSGDSSSSHSRSENNQSLSSSLHSSTHGSLETSDAQRSYPSAIFQESELSTDIHAITDDECFPMMLEEKIGSDMPHTVMSGAGMPPLTSPRHMVESTIFDGMITANVTHDQHSSIEVGTNWGMSGSTASSPTRTLSNLLQMVNKLSHHSDELRRQRTISRPLWQAMPERIMSTMDAACILCTSFLQSMDGTGASGSTVAAILLAILSEVLNICDALVAQSERQCATTQLLSTPPIDSASRPRASSQDSRHYYPMAQKSIFDDMFSVAEQCNPTQDSIYAQRPIEDCMSQVLLLQRLDHQLAQTWFFETRIAHSLKLGKGGGYASAFQEQRMLLRKRIATLVEQRCAQHQDVVQI